MILKDTTWKNGNDVIRHHVKNDNDLIRHTWNKIIRGKHTTGKMIDIAFDDWIQGKER